LLILEFLINLKTFSFIAELILILIVSVIVITLEFGIKNNENNDAKKTLTNLLTLIGFIMLIPPASYVLNNFNFNFYVSSLKVFIFPLLLLLLSLPLMYLLALFSLYELIFIRINIGEKSEKVKRLAKFKVLCICHFNLPKVQFILDKHVLDLMRIKEKEDINILINSITK